MQRSPASQTLEEEAGDVTVVDQQRASGHAASDATKSAVDSYESDIELDEPPAVALPSSPSPGPSPSTSSSASPTSAPPPPFTEADHHFMRLALQQARRAAAADEVPVGAVLVSADGATVLAAAHNRVHTLCSPLAHAEMLCLAAGAARSRAWRLLGTTLYVTLEPCPMCAGALMQLNAAAAPQARVGRVVYGARQLRLGADGSWVQLFPARRPGAQRHAAGQAAGQRHGADLAHALGAGAGQGLERGVEAGVEPAAAPAAEPEAELEVAPEAWVQVQAADGPRHAACSASGASAYSDGAHGAGLSAAAAAPCHHTSPSCQCHGSLTMAPHEPGQTAAGADAAAAVVGQPPAQGSPAAAMPAAFTSMAAPSAAAAGNRASPAAADEVPAVPAHPFHNSIVVEGGCLAEECADVIRSFFRRRRREAAEEARSAARAGQSEG
ncbi:hypothetical protein HXX76_002106 [Chlamydomonas incerta]|uniref:CMP/dCMP-type deaminase domain-containing protein n=1 Tax=Chlamydomonas incerta TaxID=51695 RepID=A0A835WAG9_CHLIN|nr:hypothetical protein HXX76_002106 [Chlamydomonas incerta]|eukprot:KAG2443760.1 hypothetical protein HXX76_002106 [Chlamydomonas incerta]